MRPTSTVCSYIYEMYELEELERMANEQGHMPEHHNNSTQGTNEYSGVWCRSPSHH